MKKFLSMLLVVVMLVPMALVANAETVTKKPFYGMSWSAVDESQQDYIRKGYTVNIMQDAKTKKFYCQLPYMGTSVTDMDQIGRIIAAEMDRLPEGTRHLNLNGFAHIFRQDVEDVIYLDNGAAQAKKLFTALIKVCKKYDAKVEGIILDFEYIGLSSYYLTSKDYVSDPLIFQKIVDNPRYATDVRPMLEERGFKFYPNPTEYTPEIWAANTKSGEEYDVSRAIWDTVMRIRLNNYLTETVYVPAVEYYPDIIVHDYHSHNTYAWYKEMDLNGDLAYLGGNSFYAGNSSSTGTYSTELGKNFITEGASYVYRKPESYSGAVFEADAFNQVLFNTNNFKNYVEATPNGNITVWVSEYDYPYGVHVTSTPYWTETLLHIGMLDPVAYLVYLYTPDFKDRPGVYDARILTLSEVLAELTRVAGYSDREPIALPTNWNDAFVLSGMYANGRNIWRLTPDTTDGMTLEEFKVAGDDPTFSHKGQTITFPGGKIIPDGEVSDVGTCGYWIETAKDVMPVITIETDRYQKFPAYLEDFESYEAGKFTASTAKYADTWVTQTKSKDPAMVIKDGDNMAMELTGTTWLVNEKLPANITAGDYYAMNQEWKVTATIPANMGEDEEVVLLKYTGSAQAYNDGGFKVANGKVYYDKEGEYVEIPGLDVSAGGTYTFKRVMHFSDEDTFISDYHVLNAEGKAIAGVKGVAVSGINLPVLTITVGCKKLEGKLILDNYSLNAYGIHSDFELFGAQFGMPVEDATKAQTEATAYRLAWQNNTANAEATAKIVAEFYEGDTKVSEQILQEMTWAPGCDGVVTGIVEVKDGQSVKLSLLSEEKKLSPDDEVISGEENTGDNGNEDNGNNDNNNNNNNNNSTGNKPAGMNIGVIAFIAVAVIGVIFIVVLLVVTKKPAKKAVAKVEEVEAPAEEAEAPEATETSEETETPDAE